MTKRMEVRCCCVPQKLLGWLDVMEGARQYAFTVNEPVRVSSWPAIKFRRIVLPVAKINVGSETYLALKSEETPIEILRMIPGFVENK